MRALKNRRGSALVVVMMFLSAFIILIGASYKLMSAEIGSSVYQARKSAAFYIAEAGMEDALQVLTGSNTWTQGFTNKQFANGY